MDYKQFGLKFLNNQFDNLENNNLIKAGLEYIDRLNYNKENLKNEFENQLKNGGYLISSIKHSIYNDLKENLQSITGESRESRKEIPRLAYELLELYTIR